MYSFVSRSMTIHLKVSEWEGEMPPALGFAQLSKAVLR